MTEEGWIRERATVIDVTLGEVRTARSSRRGGVDPRAGDGDRHHLGEVRTARSSRR
jgi:hypothetical protein